MNQPRDSKKPRKKKQSSSKSVRENTLEQAKHEDLELFMQGLETPKKSKETKAKSTKSITSIDKHQLRALLDPDSNQYDFLYLTDKNNQESLKQLKVVAPKIIPKCNLTNTYHNPFFGCKSLNFTTANDTPYPTHKLYAIICRAYWRYCDYKAAYEAKQADLHEAKTLIVKLQNSIDALADANGLSWHKGKIGTNISENGVLMRGCSILDQYYSTLPEHKVERLQEVRAALHTLKNMRKELEALTSQTQQGRSFAATYLFFIMRLCEVWIILTGKPSNPDYSKPKDQVGVSRARNPEFEGFMVAALELTKLGTSGLDHALRIISGQETRMPEQFSDELKNMSRRIKALPQKYHNNLHFTVLDFESHGWSNHYNLVPEPNSYIEQAPNPDYKGFNR